jgi:hypothetical protein
MKGINAMQIGFIGTGTMGTPIAGCLIRAGHSLSVYDHRSETTAELCAQGAGLPQDWGSGQRGACVDGPWSARGFGSIWRSERVRSCVRPSTRCLHDRWPRWVSPNRPQTRMRHATAFAPSGISCSLVRPIVISCWCPLLLGDDERSGGAEHVDLYDRVNLIPWDKLHSFFDQHLA